MHTCQSHVRVDAHIANRAGSRKRSQQGEILKFLDATNHEREVAVEEELKKKAVMTNRTSARDKKEKVKRI